MIPSKPDGSHGQDVVSLDQDVNTTPTDLQEPHGSAFDDQVGYLRLQSLLCSYVSCQADQHLPIVVDPTASSNALIPSSDFTPLQEEFPVPVRSKRRSRHERQRKKRDAARAAAAEATYTQPPQTTALDQQTTTTTSSESNSLTPRADAPAPVEGTSDAPPRKKKRRRCNSAAAQARNQKFYERKKAERSAARKAARLAAMSVDAVGGEAGDQSQVQDVGSQSHPTTYLAEGSEQCMEN